MLTGIAASPGVGDRPGVPCIEPEELAVRESEIEACDVGRTRCGFRDALDALARDLAPIRDGIAAELGEDEARDLRRPPADPRRS